MIHITIDSQKTKLPYKIARGSANDRIKKAIQYSDKFFDNIKDTFKKGDISTRTFASVLRKTAGGKVGIDVIESLQPGAVIYPSLDANGVFIGHTILLPVNAFSKKISAMSTKTFMHEVFHFFDHLLNPKYNRRTANLINSGISYEIGPFYTEKVYTKEKLTNKMLDDVLKGLTSQQKIDALQYFRYNLILERNAYQESAKYQRMMEKALNTGYREETYKGSQYHFDEKIKLIEEKLLRVIQKERAKK